MLEVGSGSSTLWFARRSARILSLESDSSWHASVISNLDKAGVTNCSVELCELADLGHSLRSYADEQFDLIVIDCHELGGKTRMECLEPARAKLKRGGLLLLDDSDRPRYRAADTLLEGWPVQRFVGLKARPLRASETSIYTRPI